LNTETQSLDRELQPSRASIITWNSARFYHSRYVMGGGGGGERFNYQQAAWKVL